MIKTTCPECAAGFDVDDERLGKKAKCGECGHVFIVEAGKKKKEKSDGAEQHHGWLSLYLAGLSLLLLIYRGNQTGMLASVVLAMAMETAALFLAWRGLLLVLPGRLPGAPNEVTRTALMVNGILVGIFALSLLLTIYSLIASQGSPAVGGMGGNLKDLLKTLQDANKLIPQ